MQNLSLYIHIPFCESKCNYCSFCSIKATEDEKTNYVDNLIKEIQLASKKYKDFIVKTIYIGGGTPSCLKLGEISKISKTIFSNFNIDKNCEFSIEANPNSLTFEKCIEYKKTLINRVSVGLQSYDNKILKSLNRVHTKKDFEFAINNLKLAGFENINADIILGTPYLTLNKLKNTLKKLVKLNLTHISCYSLILEENTKLFNLVKNGEIKLSNEEKNVKFYDFCVNFLKKHGYSRYEVSNFSKPNFECKHNLVYWNLDNYLGLGLSSHSKIDNLRFNNFSNFDDYYNALKNGNLPIENENESSLKEIKEEYIMLKLREISGINLTEFNKKFNENLLETKKIQIEFLTKNKFIEISENNLFVTNLGFKVLNKIILELV